MSIFTNAIARPAAELDPPAQPTTSAHARTWLFAAAAMLAAATALVGLVAAPANPAVGGLPSADYRFGDCTVRVGTVPETSGGAVGGTDLVCDHRRSYLGINVALWRYGGASWQLISSGSTTGYRNESDSARTEHPSYLAGCASWDITASVNVDGDKISLDYGALKGFYPRYDPTHPSVRCP